MAAGTLEIDVATIRLDAAEQLTLLAGAAHVHARTPLLMQLRGGTVEMFSGPAYVQLDVTATGTTIDPMLGIIRLRTTSESRALSLGELIVLDEKGATRIEQVAPLVDDLALVPKGRIVIHDPNPPTAAQFRIGEVCPNGGIVQLMARSYGSPQLHTGGSVTGNLSIPAGSWAYSVRCLRGDSLGGVVETAEIVVLKDSAARRLPTNLAAVNTVYADGRNYRISYQTVIPSVEFRLRTSGGKHFRLHIARDGREDTFDGSTPTIVVPGFKLADGQYTYWFDRDGVKDTNMSTVTFDFDETAPQLLLDSPADGSRFAGKQTVVRGMVLPGWTLSFDGIEIPVDLQGRFQGRIPAHTTRAFALRSEHPARGVHYYLRRP